MRAQLERASSDVPVSPGRATVGLNGCVSPTRGPARYTSSSQRDARPLRRRPDRSICRRRGTRAALDARGQGGGHAGDERFPEALEPWAIPGPGPPPGRLRLGGVVAADPSLPRAPALAWLELSAALSPAEGK